MSVVLPIVGGLLVLVTLREVFQTLFHPAGQDNLTIGVFRAVWALTGKLGDRARSISGPLAEQHLGMAGAETDEVFREYRRRHHGREAGGGA